MAFVISNYKGENQTTVEEFDGVFTVRNYLLGKKSGEARLSEAMIGRLAILAGLLPACGQLTCRDISHHYCQYRWEVPKERDA